MLIQVLECSVWPVEVNSIVERIFYLIGKQTSQENQKLWLNHPDSEVLVITHSFRNKVIGVGQGWTAFFIEGLNEKLHVFCWGRNDLSSVLPKLMQ
jgi:hypothetical protein